MNNHICGLIVLCSFVFATACKEKPPEYINQPPTAKIKASVTKGDKPLDVDFDGSLSSDPEEGNLSFHWDFGDETYASGMTTSKTFTEDGSYNIKLTVTDEEGLQDSDQTSITVDTPPPPPNLFPLTENAQWVYLVKATSTENGEISGYEEGLTYLTVKKLNLEYEYTEFIDLRITGKKFYNRQKLGDFIYLSHVAGKTLGVKHDVEGTYKTMIDLGKSSWNNFAMFFSRSSSQSVTLSSSNLTLGVGTFPSYKVYYQRDNWGEKYVTERFDVSEQEFLNPQVGLLYRKTSRYVNYLDCFTCPIYGGGFEIELVGYYIPQADGTVLEGGYGYNPNNPYGGNLGQLVIWASEDIGYTEVSLDGEYVGMITNYWTGGVECDQPKALNVSKPDGSYLLTAESNQGYYWEGYITFVEGVCDAVEFTLNKKGIGGSKKIFESGAD